MQKNLKFILIGVIVILLALVAYLTWSNSRDGRRSVYFQDKEAAEYQGRDKEKGMVGAVAARPNQAGNMPPAQVPAPLTSEQSAQLKAGVSPHQPAAMVFNVVGGSFYFTPNEIRVKQGDQVKIIFTNAGGMHNLTFDDFKVQTKTIKTGESDTIEFTADKKGTFEFYCGVGNGYHRQQGQIGVLLVE